MKKYFLLLFMLVIASPSYSQSLNSDVNNILSSYIKPIFAICMLVGAIGGFLKNWKLISDSNDQGTRKEGLMNVGYILLYAFITASALTLIMSTINSVSFSV